jgi:AraC-like DNA-binding protein
MNASNFTLREIPEPKKLGIWRDAIHRTYQTVDCRKVDGTPLLGDIRVAAFGDLEVSEVASPPMTYARGAEEIAAGREAHFQLVLAVSGHGTYRQRSAEVNLGVGDMVIYSSLEHSEVSFPAASLTQVIKIPSKLLEDKIDSVDRIAATFIDGSSPEGCMARQLIQTCVAVSMGGGVTDDRLSDGALQILAAVIDNSLPGAGNSRFSSSLKKVKKYIEKNLSDPGLNIIRIAKENGVSTRTMNRMFATEGTTAVDWMWSRRLAASHKILTEGKVKQVGQAAFDCGFSDLSHFGRVFKKRYGYLPNELLRRQ